MLSKRCNSGSHPFAFPVSGASKLHRDKGHFRSEGCYFNLLFHFSVKFCQRDGNSCSVLDHHGLEQRQIFNTSGICSYILVRVYVCCFGGYFQLFPLNFYNVQPSSIFFFPKLDSRDRQGQQVLLLCTALLKCTGGAELH